MLINFLDCIEIVVQMLQHILEMALLAQKTIFQRMINHGLFLDGLLVEDIKNPENWI